MLYKAEDYLKDDEFVGNFLELVTSVLTDDEELNCKDMTLQEVADKMKNILLPFREVNSEVSEAEVREMKMNIFDTLGVEL